MRFTNEIIEVIKNYIVENVSEHKNDILAITIEHFNISKPTAIKYMNELVIEGIIEKGKRGRYPEYRLVDTVIAKRYNIKDNLEEDVIWRNDFLPHLKKTPTNVLQACQYGFTEIVNNAIDHSQTKTIFIKLTINAKMIEIQVLDEGVGIFNKISKDLNLDDPRFAILELTKGKFTSDPERHSGEGIFFTSRIFDNFFILSYNLYFYGHKNDDWLIEDNHQHTEGTFVTMVISRFSETNISDVFNEYTNIDTTPGFHKTRVPVSLMQFEGEELISRSQAKRLISRFDKFLEVILDFTGVKLIGQAFADEIFRVFRNSHNNVKIVPVNYNENVKKMIEHVSGEKL